MGVELRWSLGCLEIVVSALFIAALGFFAPAMVWAAQVYLSGEFEGDNLIGRFSFQDESRGISVKYYSPSLGKTIFYSVEKFDECSSMAIYRIPRTRKIAVDGSCLSQGGQIYRYVYEWKSEYSNWCVIREITGERSDVASGKFSPSERVSRVTGCSTIGSTGPYSYESNADVAGEIEISLAEFRLANRNKAKRSQYMLSITSYDASEFSEHVSVENVGTLNDIAYFLAESGRSDDAIPLLDSIVQKFPGRIVAKLNLADVYWDIGAGDKASVLYGQYYRATVSGNMKGMVPKRVVDRMK
ncbi:tetratricopeptide repeat protein [Cupriavidus basilensis]|uniref:tetratricopeptide repeat protein n=1 Tax=Cupriavidus basilensis TaxID=68895 RepID=UPI0011851147|nr:tetratricopeptide repeat protein [Cupriavidus basilensis]